MFLHFGVKVFSYFPIPGMLQNAPVWSRILPGCWDMWSGLQNCA